jgi:hypothetical protein
MKKSIFALCAAALLFGCSNDNDSLQHLRQVVQPGKVVASDPRVERLIETRAPRKQVRQALLPWNPVVTG